MARKYISKGNPRKPHVMVNRNNKDAKKGVDSPKDRRGNFYMSSDWRDWTGCRATAKSPNLF